MCHLENTFHGTPKANDKMSCYSLTNVSLHKISLNIFRIVVMSTVNMVSERGSLSHMHLAGMEIAND